jgi:hypothetical protein
MNTVEPQGIFPGVTQLWHEHHNDAPLVVIRCGADTAQGRCRGEVGRVWTTPRGLLAELRQARPGREIPGTRGCRNGMQGRLIEGGELAEPKKVKVPRTP